MRERLARFMQGRYGVDKFSNFLVILALVLMVLEIFIPFIQMRRVLNSIGLLLLIYAYFRIFSRNHYKRYAENERYMKYHNKVRFFFCQEKKSYGAEADTPYLQMSFLQTENSRAKGKRENCDYLP